MTNKPILAWVAAAAALFIPRAVSAQSPTMDQSDQRTVQTAPSSASANESTHSGHTAIVGWQFRNGCELLFTPHCDGTRNRFEIRIEKNRTGENGIERTKSANVLSFETINMDASHTIFDKTFVAPVLNFRGLTTPEASAHAEAGWQVNAHAKLAGYDHYSYMFGNHMAIKVGGSFGTIEGDGKIGAQAGINVAGGTYQIGSQTLPSNTINIPAFTIPSETVHWSAINANIGGQPIHISAGTWTSPTISFPGISVKTPTIVTPPFQFTTPSIQKEWNYSLNEHGGSYFGEVRFAGAFDQSLGSDKIRMSFNPFAEVSSRAVAGAGLGLVVATSSLAGDPPNADGYLGRPFIPHKGHAVSFGFSSTTTVFDIPYYLEQREAGSAANQMNAEMRKYASLINGTAERAGQLIGITPPTLHPPEVTRDEIMGVLGTAVGLPSPLFTTTSLFVGVGGHITRNATYGASVSVPLTLHGLDPTCSVFLGWRLH